MNFHIITWEKLEKDCLMLSKKIRQSGREIDEIVSITRGGMVVARILSDLLNLPISHISIQSYNQMTGKEPVLTQASPREFHGEAILLVDELSDSGKTFHRALEYLTTVSVGGVITAAPYVKPHTKYTPDFWIESVDAWFIFPYELRETKETFVKEFGLGEAEHKLKDLHIIDWEKDA